MVHMSFPSVPWPSDVRAVFAVFSVCNIDVVDFSFVNRNVNGAVHFANTTIAMMLGFAIYFAGMASAIALINKCMGHKQPARMRGPAVCAPCTC